METEEDEWQGYRLAESRLNIAYCLSSSG